MEEVLDDGLKVGALFFDFRKAFDCVDNYILGEKLKALGVSEDMWIWMMDYLPNRSQLTQIYGASSESLLGPRLFITYVNDLPDGIRLVAKFKCMQTTLPFIPLVILLMRFL